MYLLFKIRANARLNMNIQKMIATQPQHSKKNLSSVYFRWYDKQIRVLYALEYIPSYMTHIISISYDDRAGENLSTSISSSVLWILYRFFALRQSTLICIVHKRCLRCCHIKVFWQICGSECIWNFNIDNPNLLKFKTKTKSNARRYNRYNKYSSIGPSFAEIRWLLQKTSVDKLKKKFR